MKIQGLPDVKAQISSTKVSDTDLKLRCQKLRKTLYKDQEIAATNIINILFSLKQKNKQKTDSNMFFVDGPGGSGKTYLYN